jgi:hypothetical protein
MGYQVNFVTGSNTPAILDWLGIMKKKAYLSAQIRHMTQDTGYQVNRKAETRETGDQGIGGSRHKTQDTRHMTHDTD